MLIEARAKMVRELDSETRWNASDETVTRVF